MEFYVSIDGRKRGPFSHYEINDRLRSGEIDGDSLIWMRGQEGWKKLREIPALQSSIEEKNLESDETDEGVEFQKDDSASHSPPLPAVEAVTRKTLTVPYEVRPLTRFWARSFDYLLVTVLVWTISDIALPASIADPNLTFGDLMTRYAEEFRKEEWQRFAHLLLYSQLAWHVIEGMLLHVFGTTPGKALFGISIQTNAGERPSILRGISRSFYVYIAGVAMYFIPFSVVCMTLSFFRLVATGKTFWDDQLKLTVRHPPLGFARILLAIVAFLVLMIVNSLKFS